MALRARLLGLWPQEVLHQLEHGGGTDVLREVPATGLEHPGDLAPPDGGGMAAGHQVERLVGERQRALVRVRDDHHAARVQELGSFDDIRWPGLRGHHRGRELGGPGQDFPAPGLDVQRRERRRQAVAHQ
jgi:hypothetical protein